VVWLPGDGVVVVDCLLARRRHRVRSRLHLAVGLSGTSLQVGPFAVTALGTGAVARVTPGRYAPYLGVAMPIDVIEYASDVAPLAPFGWALLRPDARATIEDGRLLIERARHAPLELELKPGGDPPTASGYRLRPGRA
jgi:hypothetical protein